MRLGGDGHVKSHEPAPGPNLNAAAPPRRVTSSAFHSQATDALPDQRREGILIHLAVPQHSNRQTPPSQPDSVAKHFHTLAAADANTHCRVSGFPVSSLTALSK
ncbi:hypothetical protein V2G26_009846 [Clonostachys chloroleuca]